MGRGKHEQCWEHAEKVVNENKWICKYCNRKFGGGASRIEAHLGLNGKGGGIRRCSNYPPVAGNEGVQNYNNMASTSSNPPEAVTNRVVYSTQDQGVPEVIGTHTRNPVNHQNNAEIMNLSEVAEGVPQVIGTHTRSSVDHQNNAEIVNLSEGVNGSGGNISVSESETNQLNQLILDLKCEENDMVKELQSLESRGKKRKREVNVWLRKLQEMKGNLSNGTSDVSELIKNMKRHKEEKPLTLSTEFVGEQLDLNIKRVFELLEDDKVFVIGICGMGGVGKTLLATLMENEVKRKVFWVTVSHNYNISKLQHDIAKRIGVQLDEDDERIRAKNLTLALEKEGKSILILDDVWKYIDLQKVGIHPKVNGIKVILTTRLKHVCHRMDCQPYAILQMSPLAYNEYGDSEAWELFLLKLGHDGTPMTLPREIEKIVKCIVARLDGLPLAINVMARTMKGIDDFHQWKHALNKLEMGEMVEDEVFKVLKCSFDNLMEKNLQNFFLYCALLSPGDCDEIRMTKEELIMKLVDNGQINGSICLEEIFVEGNTIMNKLESHSLITFGFHSEVLTHSLVRNMACYIWKENQRNAMVKLGKGSSKIPLSHEWATDLELVRMSDYGLKQIPEGMSPNCPKLSTLIINDVSISHVPESFFIYMNSLSILDLSYNRWLESLPNSVSELRSLVSLVLKECDSLKHVPPLGELQTLSRLVISYTSIEEAPQGLGKLINLKWLDLSYNAHTFNVDLLYWSFSSNLTKIQYLDLRYTNVWIEVKDILKMKMLESLGVAFDGNDYNQYMQKNHDTSFDLKTYHIRLLGDAYDDEIYWGSNVNLTRFDPSDPETKTILFRICDNFSQILPEDLTCLYMEKNSHWDCLCDALSYNTFSSLRKIVTDNWQQLKSLFCLSGSCSFCIKIHNLEVLKLVDLESLTSVCKDVVDVRQSLTPPGDIFSCLKQFSISFCHLIEKLFTPQLVLQLQNLETIIVHDCNSMKEIFAVSNSDDNDSSIITLPKLTKLELDKLPQLKTVCKGIIRCGSSKPSLKMCYQKFCPELERLPTVKLIDGENPCFGIFP